MSTPEAASLAFAIVLFFLGLLVVGLCRAAGRASRAEEQRPVPQDSYEGPDSLRLLEDLEAHMKAYGQSVADYYDTTPGGPQ